MYEDPQVAIKREFFWVVFSALVSCRGVRLGRRQRRVDHKTREHYKPDNNIFSRYLPYYVPIFPFFDSGTLQSEWFKRALRGIANKGGRDIYTSDNCLLPFYIKKRCFLIYGLRDCVLFLLFPLVNVLSVLLVCCCFFRLGVTFCCVFLMTSCFCFSSVAHSCQRIAYIFLYVLCLRN